MAKILGYVLLLSVVIVSASTSGGFSFQPVGNYPKAFVTYKTVEPPGVLASYLQGINDKGVVVGGYCDTYCNPGSSEHGYPPPRWQIHEV